MPANIYKNKDGKRVPGVTTVINRGLGWGKSGLMHWAWEQGINGLDYRNTRDEAAVAGTIAHAMVEHEVKGEKFEWPELGYRLGGNAEQIKWAENAFSDFATWKQQVNFELLQAEHMLVSEKHQYGGQIDIAAINGNRSIIDIKTSKTVYDSHKLQLAAYGNLWNENYPDEPIEAYYILRLSKDSDAGFSHNHWYRLDNAWRAFVIVRELYDLEKLI